MATSDHEVLIVATPSWQHVAPRGHDVPDITLTRFEDGASLCAVCMSPVTLTDRAAREAQREIDARTASWHATLVGMSLPVGTGTAYGPCSPVCHH